MILFMFLSGISFFLWSTCIHGFVEFLLRTVQMSRRIEPIFSYFFSYTLWFKQFFDFILFWHQQWYTALFLGGMELLAFSYSVSFFYSCHVIPFLTGVMHLLFFLALFVTLYTDFSNFVIFRCVTLWLIPINLIASYFHTIPVVWFESIAGAFCGAGFLWLVRFLFWKLRKKEGLGLGDIDLAGYVGSFVGAYAIFKIIFFASVIGLLCACFAVFLQKNNQVDFNQLRIPFGSCIAIASILLLVSSSLQSNCCIRFF